MQYKQLDGLRFIAVMAVLLHHFFGISSLRFLELGPFGVNLFFVISGFLITEILIREKIKGTSPTGILKTFFTRRILRIFPLYYLYIFICFLIVPVETHQYINWLLTYTINIWITLNNQLTHWYFTHLWSLGVEEQFYILWPFLILFSPLNKLKPFFIIMIAVAIIYRVINTFCIPNYELFNYTMLPTTLDCFGAGALLAYLKTFNPIQLNNTLKHKYFIPIGILLFLLNNLFGTALLQQSLTKGFIAFIAFYLVGISTTTLFNGAMKSILENRIIRYFGKISYGIYIYHLLIYGLFGKYSSQLLENLPLYLYNANSTPGRFLEFILLSLCTIIVAIISFEMFENRILALKKYSVYSGIKTSSAH